MTLERFRAAMLGLCMLAWGYFASLGYGRIAELSAHSSAGISPLIYYFVIPAGLTIEALFALIYRLRQPFARVDAWLIAVPVILLPIYVLTRT